MSESKPPKVRTLLATFSLPITSREIPRWRGAFVEMAGRHLDLLHNHQGDEGYHYRYPLIQYRNRLGNAAIIAMNEGVMAVQQALSQNSWQIRWKGEPIDLNIDNLQVKEYELCLLPKLKTYHLHRWIALNDENYEKWCKTPFLKDRVELLENVLAGHILHFASAMDWQVPENREIHITNIKRQTWVRVHGVRLLAFDIVYQSNIFLPSLVGLGKSVSHGFGWQVLGRSRSTRKLEDSIQLQARSE